MYIQRAYAQGTYTKVCAWDIKPGDIYMGAYKQVLVHGELRHGGPKDKGFRAYKHNSMVCSSLAFTVVTKTWLCC